MMSGVHNLCSDTQDDFCNEESDRIEEMNKIGNFISLNTYQYQFNEVYSVFSLVLINIIY